MKAPYLNVVPPPGFPPEGRSVEPCDICGFEYHPGFGLHLTNSPYYPSNTVCLRCHNRAAGLPC